MVHGVAQLWEQAELGTNFGSPGSPTNAVGSVNGTGTNAATNIWGPIGFERLQGDRRQLPQVRLHRPGGPGHLSALPRARASPIPAAQLAGCQPPFAQCGRGQGATYNVEVEQQIIDNLFLEAGWYREQFTTVQHNYLGGNVGNAVQVDPNTRFLNGTPNPYFGDALHRRCSRATTRSAPDLNEQERLSLVYQLDFTKNNNWTKWLGHHTLQAFYQHRDVDDATLDLPAHGSPGLPQLEQHDRHRRLEQRHRRQPTRERYYLSNGGAAISFDPGAVHQHELHLSR